MPKNKGGLGLRKIDSVNKAFQCKLAWKVLTNETSLWIQILKDKYLKDTTFFEYKKKSTDSPVWKSLLSCRDLLRQGLMWKLGNGKQISFWFDNWIGNFTLADTINLPVEALPSPEARVSDFILQSHTWDIDKLKQTLSDHSIITKIQGITIPVHDMEDSFCWGLHSSGNFSTKSATWLARGPQATPNYDWPHKWIWKIDTVPKIKVFLWQLCHKAIPVRGLLLRKGLQIDPICPICLDDLESMEHLFNQCCLINKVWRITENHRWLPPGTSPDHNQTMLQFLQMVKCSGNSDILRNVTFLLWSIWKKNGNKVVFKNEGFQPLACIIQAKKAYAE